MPTDPIARCDRELAHLEQRLLSGEEPVDGILLGIHDWSAEKRLLERERPIYEEFLRAKVELSKDHGFEIDASEIHSSLLPHQKVGVRWGVRGGRRALFESFGLGKTRQQLEILRLIIERVGGRALIVAPLGVRQEFAQDAAELGIQIRFVRSIEECGETGIYITNYETVREGKLDPSAFTATSLDEASVLRGFGGTKTFREFMRLFETVPYRFVATATPDPNEYIELLAYAAYLGIMDVGQAKTRFFKRDSTKADKLTLHPHKEEEFWLWVASWALFLQKPSDLGFDDTGYDLPAMRVHYHEVKANHDIPVTDRDGQTRLFREAATGVVDAARAKRDSLTERVDALIRILKGYDETGISEGLLRKEQRGTTGKAEGKEPKKLPTEQGGIPRTCETVEGGQSGKGKGAGANSSREPEGVSPAKVKGVVSPESRASLCDEQEEQAEALWNNPTGVCGDVSQAESLLPDLQRTPKGSGNISGGPLPQNRRCSRSSLPGVQLGTGPLQGRSRETPQGGGVSDQWVIWCDLNSEQRALEQSLEHIGVSHSSIYGSLDIEERESRLDLWRNRKTEALISKPVMLGSGVNLQQCHRAIFVGIGFKFADFIQAMHRVHRFLQTKAVEIHIIYSESEREVLRKLLDKWERHKEKVQRMSEIIKEYGLSDLALAKALTRSIGVERVEIKGDRYRLVNNDCVLETRDHMKSDSVGLVLTSIPFSTQYEYTPSYNDFGHTESNGHFFRQMDYLTPELHRVLMPGRIAAIHVKDRVVPGGMTGYGVQSVYPFHADCIQHFVKHGFVFMGMKTIVTDVVRENNQTYRLGWSEQCKDATKMGYGMPEYLLLFRKPQTDRTKGYADIRVKKDKTRYSKARWQVDAHGFTRSAGNRPLTPEEVASLPLTKDFHQKMYGWFHDHSLRTVYDFEHHVKIGETLEQRGQLPVTFMLLQPPSWHPDVWTDITRMLTANAFQAAKGRVKHLCPMQFDLADRVITQMSNEGDIVYDPFGGLMTVPARAVALKRFGVGVELNGVYFTDGATYCEAAAREVSMPTLFDLLDEPEDVRISA